MIIDFFLIGTFFFDLFVLIFEALDIDFDGLVSLSKRSMSFPGFSLCRSLRFVDVSQ
jgi:hypothetical protein